MDLGEFAEEVLGKMNKEWVPFCMRNADEEALYLFELAKCGAITIRTDPEPGLT